MSEQFAAPVKSYIERFASWKNLALILLLSFPFNFYLFPHRSAALKAISNLSNPILDVQFLYSPSRVYHILEALGPEGRWIYAFSESTIDLLFPLIYASFLRISLELIASGLPVSNNRIWRRLSSLPWLLMGMDYGENASLVALLLLYPKVITPLAWLASAFSSIKLSLGLVCVVLVLIGFVGLLLRKALYPDSKGLGSR